MDYREAQVALEEVVTEKDEYDVVVEDHTLRGEIASPHLRRLGDKAIFYLQIQDKPDKLRESRTENYTRVVLGEYDGEELSPVSMDESKLELILDGTGEVVIDETLLESSDYRQQETAV